MLIVIWLFGEGIERRFKASCGNTWDVIPGDAEAQLHSWSLHYWFPGESNVRFDMYSLIFVRFIWQRIQKYWLYFNRYKEKRNYNICNKNSTLRCNIFCFLNFELCHTFQIKLIQLLIFSNCLFTFVSYFIL